jgi:hypothetical protein
MNEISEGGVMSSPLAAMMIVAAYREGTDIGVEIG